MNGKGSDRRPETKPGNYERGWEDVWGVRVTRVSSLAHFLGLDHFCTLALSEHLKTSGEVWMEPACEE